MEVQPVVFFIFLLFWFWLSPNTPQQSPSFRKEQESILSKEEHALQILQNTTYNAFQPLHDRYLPFVGMRADDGFAWDALPFVQEIARKHIASSLDQVTALSDETKGNANPATPSLPVYRNMSGYVRGDWVRTSHPEGADKPHVNLTSLVPGESYVTHEFGHNVTGSEGNLRLQMTEIVNPDLHQATSDMREIKAELTFHTDSTPYYGMSTHMHGVHLPDLGAVVLTTTSEKFPGIFALPHLMLSAQHFDSAKLLLNESISNIIEKQKDWSGSVGSSPWSSTHGDANNLLFPTPTCEYIAYLQQHPLVFGGSHLELPEVIEALENELRWPKGAPAHEVPPMIASIVVFSPDCGIILQSKGPPDFPPAEARHLTGMKDEAYSRHSKDFTVAFCILVILQNYLLIKQVKEASTPSMQSRISVFTIGIMATGDGILFFLFIVLSMMSPTEYLILTCGGFLTFFGVGFLGMKFMLDIWTIQFPERQERDRQREQQRLERIRAQTPAPAPATAPALELPLPVTASRPRPIDTGATPILLPPDQDMDAAEAEDNAAATTTTRPTPTTAPATTAPVRSARSEASTLYARFYFQLCAIFLLTASSIFWPEPLRKVYVYVVSLIYLGFWVPQIYRNVMRNCRKALRWDYVIGQSILRLVPFLYIYCMPGNIFFIEEDTTAAWALAGWLWIQVWALLSQEILGPRFFVPADWAPPAYDYHPVLRDSVGEDVESGNTLPIGYIKSDQAVVSPSEFKDKTQHSHHKRYFDCAICMQTIDVPVIVVKSSNDHATTDSSLQDSTSVSTNLATSILGRRTYMVTPCRHIFHTDCLEGWMRQRLQCPICRENLPSL